MQYSSHSLKDTSLAWGARAGLSHRTRAHLGGHKRSKDDMTLLYGRNSMGATMSDYGWLLFNIAEGNMIQGVLHFITWESLIVVIKYAILPEHLCPGILAGSCINTAFHYKIFPAIWVNVVIEVASPRSRLNQLLTAP